MRSNIQRGVKAKIVPFLRLFVLLAAIAFLVLPLSYSCNIDLPNPLYLQIENQTDHTLTIRVDGEPSFSVHPEKSIKSSLGRRFGNIFVESLSENGEIVYAHIVGGSEIKYSPFGNLIKLTILPKEENPYLPLQVENRLVNPIIVSLGIPQSVSATVGRVEPGATLLTRPLPPDESVYNIFAFEVLPGGKLNPRDVLNRTYTQSELKEQNWKITIDNSNTVK